MSNNVLGQTMTDQITGFSGVVVGYVEYISGCNQAFLVPKIGKGGKRQDGEWFDIQRLTVKKGTKRIVLDNGDTPGCDAPAPKR